MLSVGAASIACEKKCALRSWRGLVESARLKTSTSVRLGVQLFRENEPTCSLAVWASVVPPSAMQHAVLLGHYSWMRFNSRSYRFLPPRPSDQRVFGELEIVHHAPTGIYIRVRHRPHRFGWRLPLTLRGRCSRRHPARRPPTASCQLGSPRWRPGAHWTLLGRYDALARPSFEENFVTSGRQALPLVGVADLEPGSILGVAHAPLLSVPLMFFSRVTQPRTLPPAYLRCLRSHQSQLPPRSSSLALACTA